MRLRALVIVALALPSTLPGQSSVSPEPRDGIMRAFETFGFAPFQSRFSRRDALQGRVVTLSDGSFVLHAQPIVDLLQAEIARIVDCPVDTVKTRMFYARRHLKQSLSGELADWI